MKGSKWLLCSALTVVLGVAAVALWIASGSGQSERVLLTVDGSPVTEAAFTLFLKNERAATVQYFYTTYGAETGEHFWTTDFNGETPSEYGKKQALSAVVAYWAERQLAMERGLVESADFADLMSEMEQINLENDQRAQKGEVVYGLRNFSPWQYLLYEQSNLDVALLKDEIERNRTAITEEVLRERYEAEKETYRAEPDITYERLEAPQDTPLQVLDQLSAAVEDGETLAAAASRLLNAGSYTVTEAVSAQETIGKDDMWEQELRAEVLILTPGQVTPPVYLADCVCVARCIERVEPGYLTFEEAREDVLYLLSQQTLRDALDRRAEAATVELEEKRFEEFPVEASI